VSPERSAERGRSVSVAAPAKVNLYLHLTGRRADGYHLLDSLVFFAPVADALTIGPADGLHLAIEGPFAAPLREEADNLVLAAARTLAQAGGVRARAAIRLEKRIPVAAGVGGGSADAAAALRGLARFWDLRPARDDLLGVALALGADVPVCVGARAAYVGGIGEEVEPLDAPWPQVHAVLVNPGVVLPTANVFRDVGAISGAPMRFAAPRDAAALASALAERSNDLEPAARGLAPIVGTVLEALAALPGCLLARMSGSGPTCFGIFASLAEANAAAAAIGRAYPAWWVTAGPLASAAPETVAHGFERNAAPRVA